MSVTINNIIFTFEFINLVNFFRFRDHNNVKTCLCLLIQLICIDITFFFLFTWSKNLL